MDSPPARRDDLDRQLLRLARRHMREALDLLDTLSASAAAATLDMALHQLEREFTRLDEPPTGPT